MSRTRTTRRILATAASLLTLGLLASCNIFGPAFFLVHGPGSVEAEYELDPTRSTVILIDDPTNRVTRRRYRGIIAETAQNVLLQKKVIDDGKMIDGRAAVTMAATATSQNPLSIQDIGEAVRADIVIYALVSEFRGSDFADKPSPSVTLHVKVIDVVTGERVWPEQPEGYTLSLKMPTAPGNLATSRADMARIEEDLAAFTGLGLSQLFYSVERPQSVRLP
ncbi:MAG: hypothetical protein CMJ31_14290 [Phycisphaerae bacterium]|nr:hypothetical protein [Phycisphaerae bacterium]